MKVVVAGASGFVGDALLPALRGEGYRVLRLVRREARADDEVPWNPSAGALDIRALDGVHAAINLSGENLAGKRWSAEQKERIFKSRVDTTRTLAAALARLSPKPQVLINASAVGIYGDRGDERLDEGATSGQGFLAEICRVWEAETELAAQTGIRTVRARLGTILAREGGALAKMLPVFRWGLGGPFGSGRQWMSWVSRDDVVGALLHALKTTALAGPVNIVAPEPVTNREFAATLGRVLHRPAFFPAPAWALRLAVGREMADEALLASARAMPATLSQSGYRFRHPELDEALRAALGKSL